jgi:hypothetical protein
VLNTELKGLVTEENCWMTAFHIEDSSRTIMKKKLKDDEAFYCACLCFVHRCALSACPGLAMTSSFCVLR